MIGDKLRMSKFRNVATYGSCAEIHHSQACDEMALLSRYRVTVGKHLNRVKKSWQEMGVKLTTA